MKYITAICYNVKKDPFRKVTYLANPFDDVSRELNQIQK